MAGLTGSKSMARGTEEQFDQIVAYLQNNIKQYEAKAIKYIAYLDAIDKIFSGGYGWSKAEFYDEVNRRLGIQTNDSKRADKAAKEAAKKLPVKGTPAKKKSVDW